MDRRLPKTIEYMDIILRKINILLYHTIAIIWTNADCNAQSTEKHMMVVYTFIPAHKTDDTQTE